MNETLIVVTLAMAAVGLWRVKFWPKLFMAVAVFLLAALLICFGFAEAGKEWEHFSEFVWGKNFWLPFIGLFSVSALMHVIRKEKEILKDPKESKSDAAFPWFLLAIASTFAAFIEMIIIFYRYEFALFIWLPIIIVYVVSVVLGLYYMNSDKRKKMLATALSIYLFAVAELIVLISL